MPSILGASLDFLRSRFGLFPCFSPMFFPAGATPGAFVGLFLYLSTSTSVLPERDSCFIPSAFPALHPRLSRPFLSAHARRSLPLQVGRYQILETLGTGAYSRVVRGHDPLIDRNVAIKLFSPDLARGDARNRFLREARVVGKLSHPSIITVHDMGIEESTQTPYLVMELVEGQPLDKIVSKGSVPFSTACDWAAHVAVALSVSHRRAVIHGDVKPANILITLDNRVKLTDFGMARLASHQGPDSSVRGTPAYWCPEQILGRAQDARSDLFSLGVVLYEMLAGLNPFDGDSIPTVCNRILSCAPLPPSSSNPSIPASLDDLVGSCLAKEPQLRMASAEALAEQLFPFARRKPAQAQPVAAPELSLRSRAARLLRSA
jgi:serine/threonine protein kinase